MVADAGRRGYELLVSRFLDEAGGGIDRADGGFSGPAFCKARRKMPPAYMRWLLHRTADAFDARFGAGLRWLNGRRAFAVDGSKFNLRRHGGLRAAFGVPDGAHCPQMLVSTLFDVVAKVPHDIVAGPYASSERSHLLEMLDRLRTGDVLVLDRGYPSFEVFCALTDRGIDFAIRVPSSCSFKGVDDFMQSGGTDYRVLLLPPAKGALRGREPVEVRAVLIRGPGGGEPTVILTSLRKREASRRALAGLYRMRWEVEEFYRIGKSDYAGQGQFRAKSEDGVLQEVTALALFVGACRYMMAMGAGRAKGGYASLSAKTGILATGDYLVRLFLESDPERLEKCLARLLARIVHVTYPKRPGRKYPRRSLKPAPKWGARGRRAG